MANDLDEFPSRVARFDAGTELGPRVFKAGIIDGTGPLAGPTRMRVDSQFGHRDKVPPSFVGVRESEEEPERGSGVQSLIANRRTLCLLEQQPSTDAEAHRFPTPCEEKVWKHERFISQREKGAHLKWTPPSRSREPSEHSWSQPRAALVRP